MRGKAMF